MLAPMFESNLPLPYDFLKLYCAHYFFSRAPPYSLCLENQDLWLFFTLASFYFLDHRLFLLGLSVANIRRERDQSAHLLWLSLDSILETTSILHISLQMPCFEFLEKCYIL